MRSSWLVIVAGLMVVPRLSGVITHGLFAMFVLCAWSFSASGLLTSKGVNIEGDFLFFISVFFLTDGFYSFHHETSKNPTFFFLSLSI
jgi:hypothetical protein